MRSAETEAKLYPGSLLLHNRSVMMWLALRLILILALIAFNGFFVASEYALLTVRRTRIDQLALEGDARARLVEKLLSDVGLLFSGIQLGITAASLLLGWLGEGAFAQLFLGLLAGRLHPYVSAVIAHSLAVILAFVLVTTLLMVLGELVPKTIGYERAEQVALLNARLMTLFLALGRYPVQFLDWLSERVILAMGRFPRPVHGSQHTAEEVKLIVSAIRKRGLLEQEQEEIIRSVFDLNRVLVREVMVPWPKVTRLEFSQNIRQLASQAAATRHSRVPVFEGSPDHIIGILYARDLLDLVANQPGQPGPARFGVNLRSILHPPMIVPETMPLSHMLAEARRKRSQMALVVDEFGTYVGVATIEDVFDQIVGEIHDAGEHAERAIERVGEHAAVVDGALSVREFADAYGIGLPRGAGYQTVAGFVLARLGSIPRGDESFVFEGHRFTVLGMEGRRVTKVKVETLQGAGRETAGQTGEPKPASRQASSSDHTSS